MDGHSSFALYVPLPGISKALSRGLTRYLLLRWTLLEDPRINPGGIFDDDERRRRRSRSRRREAGLRNGDHVGGTPREGQWKRDRCDERGSGAEPGGAVGEWANHGFLFPVAPYTVRCR